jgi:hypothetical protein
MSADKTQVGGNHYVDMDIQPWDAMRAWMTPDQFCGYLLGTAVAYLARVNVAAPGKGGIDDIEKARHVLAKLAETWHYRIFREFPKEVMQAGPVRGFEAGEDTATTPAVSESAAGDVPRATEDKLREIRSRLNRPGARELHEMSGADDCQHDFVVVTLKGEPTKICERCYGHMPYDSPRQAALAEKIMRDNGEAFKALAESEAADRAWPGPDWSQAPEGATGWVGEFDGRARWIFGDGQFSETGQWLTTCRKHSLSAPNFNYQGHWRDSLRRRPT